MWVHRCLPCLQKHRMDKQITILTFNFSFINQLIQYERRNLLVRLWKNARLELSNILENDPFNNIFDDIFSFCSDQ